MRKRNLELTQNIGELTEEINKQDLETVNGGDEGVNKATPAATVVISTVQITTWANDKITEYAGCGGVLTVTKECLCKK